MGAFNKHMEDNLRNSKMKERMQNKLADNKASIDVNKVTNNITSNGINSEGMEQFIFSSGDPSEKSTKTSKKKNKYKRKKK